MLYRVAQSLFIVFCLTACDKEETPLPYFSNNFSVDPSENPELLGTWKVVEYSWLNDTGGRGSNEVIDWQIHFDPDSLFVSQINYCNPDALPLDSLTLFPGAYFGTYHLGEVDRPFEPGESNIKFLDCPDLFNDAPVEIWLEGPNLSLSIWGGYFSATYRCEKLVR